MVGAGSDAASHHTLLGDKAMTGALIGAVIGLLGFLVLYAQHKRENDA